MCCPLCRTPGLFAAPKSLGFICVLSSLLYSWSLCCICVLSSLLYSWSLCCTQISWLYLCSVLFVVLLVSLLHPNLLAVSVVCPLCWLFSWLICCTLISCLYLCFVLLVSLLYSNLLAVQYLCSVPFAVILVSLLHPNLSAVVCPHCCTISGHQYGRKTDGREYREDL